jgi:hypothetical protein
MLMLVGTYSYHCDLRGELSHGNSHCMESRREFHLCVTVQKYEYLIYLSPPHLMAQQPPSGSGPPHNRGFTIILRRTTLGWIPLDGDQLVAETST